MGYYTRFNLTEHGNSEEVIARINEVSGHPYGVESDEIKWYNWNEDIVKVSNLFPDTLITISGVGEEFPDMWIAYAKNGKIQVEEAIITYPPFDETKLK